MSLRMEHGGESEREALAPLRASSWKTILSEDQYVGRNQRLYLHPFGKERMETFVLRDEANAICASMDAIRLSFLVKVGPAPAEERPGILIASVITAPQDRKKGYATTLLTKYFEANPKTSGVLYSDIGPPFYERFGFRATPVRAREIPATVQAQAPAPLEFDEGVKQLRAIRWAQIAHAPSPAGVVFPDRLWLDWHIERYRYFATLAGREFSQSGFWSVVHRSSALPHLIFAAPHFPANRLETLWVTPGCEECHAALSGLAATFGLKSVFFWDRSLASASGKTECPMIRLPEVSGAIHFEDPQYGDSW